MYSTVQSWRGKNSMFAQGFVPATSPWVGTSSVQSSAEGMGTAGTTLFLTEAAIFVDRFVPTQQCLPLYFASGVHISKLDGAINLGGIFPFRTRLLSSVFLLLHVHAPLYSRCTGVCICTCAPRQTPHEHMRISVLGSVCVCMYSVCVLRPRNIFPVSCTPLDCVDDSQLLDCVDDSHLPRDGPAQSGLQSVNQKQLPYIWGRKTAMSEAMLVLSGQPLREYTCNQLNDWGGGRGCKMIVPVLGGYENSPCRGHV